jgi:hypothetical protein
MDRTHTYAILPVSKRAYDEIRAKLEAADYHHAFHGELIDMCGIALQAEPPEEPEPIGGWLGERFGKVV